MEPTELPAEAQIDRELCRRSLYEFVKEAWHIVEPAHDFVEGWHIQAICEHLEAVTRGEIRNLLVNMPPRHMKSLGVSVFWLPWVWANHPEKRFLYSSYDSKLATRDSVRSRRIIQSDWYQSRWGDVFNLTGDQNVKTRFENDHTGIRISTSVGGSGTGEGGDFVVCDDPHSVDEAYSEKKRRAAIRWWDNVMSTRLDDPKTGSKVVVGQRVHHQDLSAKLKDRSDWEHLLLPSEYEPDRNCQTSIGWEDPRDEGGALLWPDRYGPEEIDSAKEDLGSWGFASQHQQRPTPREGGFFSRDWFDIVEQLPDHKSIRIVRYWDKAGTQGDGNYSAGVKMARVVTQQDEVKYFVLHVIRGQWSPGKREKIMETTAKMDGKDVVVWVEQEPGSAGKESAQNTVDNLDGFTVRVEKVTGSKQLRADSFAAKSEAGRVILLQGPWNDIYLDELQQFPNSDYNDQVDASSGAYNALYRSGGNSLKDEHTANATKTPSSQAVTDYF